MNRRQILPLLLGVGLFSSCDTPSSSDDSEVPLLDPSNPASLQARVDKIRAEVEGIRGLKFKRPVAASWVERGHVEALMDSLDRANPTADTPNQDDVSPDELFYALGMVDTYGAFGKSSGQFLGQGITGFYAYKTDHFWLVTDQSSSVASSENTIAHELTHALQEQIFGDTLRPQELDEEVAYASLIEGEAEYVATLHSQGSTSTKTYDAQTGNYDLAATASTVGTERSLAAIPWVVKLPGLSPYIAGPSFVNQVRKSKGWSGIDSLHRHPPKSMERIYNAATLLAGNRFVDWSQAEISAMPKSKFLGSGRLGEAYLYALLHGRYTPVSGMPSVFSHAWGGDRFWAWRNRDSLSHLVVGKVRFATQANAYGFLQSWCQTLPAAQGAAARCDASPLSWTPQVDSKFRVKGELAPAGSAWEVRLLWGDVVDSAATAAAWSQLAALDTIGSYAARRAQPSASSRGWGGWFDPRRTGSSPFSSVGSR